VLIECWRVAYNTVRPHSALGYRPPAPAAVVPAPVQPGSATLRRTGQEPPGGVWLTSSLVSHVGAGQLRPDVGALLQTLPVGA
ncbi:transposase, partial [Azospirillum sp. TSA6c]|uniref:transposase n=1 Tax=Azospirillum sp. TSA6c TaxID=709813 RepID=UPI001FFFDCCF